MATKHLALMLVLAMVSPLAGAHHSRAEFTGDVIELTGELIDFSWRNPHPSFRIRLNDTANTEWEIQAYGSVGTLTQTGVAQDMFVKGQQMTFAGLASGRRQLFLGTSALLPDGTEAILQYNGQPHWSGQKVGGSGSVVVDQAQLAKAASENRGFFRVWNVESTEVAIRSLVSVFTRTQFTEASNAATANWDLTNNPITRCEPTWMPFTMIAPVDMELIDNGATLTLNNDFFDSKRTIYMESAPDSTTQPLSRLGLSRGHWEGNALVVDTDRITAPAFDSTGHLQSEQMTVNERFILSDDQSRLDYRMVMTDPVSFEEPAVYETYYLALARELEKDSDNGTCD